LFNVLFVCTVVFVDILLNFPFSVSFTLFFSFFPSTLFLFLPLSFLLFNLPFSFPPFFQFLLLSCNLIFFSLGFSSSIIGKDVLSPLDLERIFGTYTVHTFNVLSTNALYFYSHYLCCGFLIIMFSIFVYLILSCLNCHVLFYHLSIPSFHRQIFSSLSPPSPIHISLPLPLPSPTYTYPYPYPFRHT
jgi:hypothetical protein